MRFPINYRVLVTIAVPIAAFSLTIVITLHNQRMTEQPQTPASAPAALPSNREVTDNAPPKNNSRQASAFESGLWSTTRLPTAAAPQANDAQPASGADPEADSTLKKIPVNLRFQQQAGQSGQEAVITSRSKDPLDLSLILENRTTGKFAQVQVMLEPGTYKQLGVKDNLNIESGDEVRLRSLQHRDLRVEVP